jgi:hypothetical protein
MCPAARDFFARQGDLMQKYFVYFKSNQRYMAEKDLSFGYTGNFQTSPSGAFFRYYSPPAPNPQVEIDEREIFR